MNKGYYVKNIHWGLFSFLVCMFYDISKNLELFTVVNFCFGLSALLFPMSKKLIEDVVLKYSSREFWNSGIFEEGITKNKMYVFYYLVCYISAIPLGLIYIFMHLYKRHYSV